MGTKTKVLYSIYSHSGGDKDYMLSKETYEECEKYLAEELRIETNDFDPDVMFFTIDKEFRFNIEE